MAIRTPLVREEIMIPFIVQDLNVSEDILSHVLDDKLLGGGFESAIGNTL